MQTVPRHITLFYERLTSLRPIRIISLPEALSNRQNDCRAYRLVVTLAITRKPLLTLAVLFKFRAEVSAEHRQAFVKALKTLGDLPCVLNQRLTVGGPSITDPIERSKGYHFALVSYHKDRKALEEYQASDEHHKWVFLTFTLLNNTNMSQGDERVSLAVQGGCDAVRLRDRRVDYNHLDMTYIDSIV